MRTSIHRGPGMFLLWAFVCAMTAFGSARAQQLTVLHNFALDAANDPFNPNSALVEDASGNFYGTTAAGGSGLAGTVYKLDPQGNVTTLHAFRTNAVTDLTAPLGDLFFAQTTLVGTAAGGGSQSAGGFYSISGTSYGNTYSFPGASNGSAIEVPNPSNAIYPEQGAVVRSHDGNYYGTSPVGGDFGAGVFYEFKIQGTGSGYIVLHSFGGTGDAAYPWSGLVQDAQGNFYGATAKGGTAGLGAVYCLNAQGHYSVLHSFAAAPTNYTFTLGDTYSLGAPGGFSPNSELVVGSNGNLYGTAVGGTYGVGVIYSVTPSGAFTVVHAFGDGSVANDGAMLPGFYEQTTPTPNPVVAEHLILATDGNLYGTTFGGGVGNAGTVYKLSPSGQVTIIHAFGDGSVVNDGAHPIGITQGADGNFYGTTSWGGSAGYGTAFEIAHSSLSFTGPLDVTAALGKLFSYPLAVAQGPATFAVTGLPAGLSFNGTNTIFGTPSQPGTYHVTLTALNAGTTNSATLVLMVEAPPVIASLLDVVCSTSSLAYQVRATNSPTYYGATGVPVGVTFDPSTGSFYGSPITPGSYLITVTATNAVGTGTAVVDMEALSGAPTSAQEYTLIHFVRDGTVAGEGSYPGTLTLGTDSNMYGVTGEGGVNGGGTVYRLSPSGAAQVTASLGGATGSAPQGVIQTSDGSLYGTASSGGSAQAGTVFKITSNGELSVLHNFGNGTDGATPQGNLVLARDGNFYGTTQKGGSAGSGTIYQMTPGGVVTILHNFGDGSVPNDGVQPKAALALFDPGQLILVNGNGPVLAFLGTTQLGGAHDAGTVFSITNTGTYQVLHSFADTTVDGQLPQAPVTAFSSSTGMIVGSGNTVYGTTTAGGSFQKGTIFALTGVDPFTPGTTPTYSIVHHFGDGTVVGDGENPNSALIADSGAGNGSPYSLSSNSPSVLYGTTLNGGANHGGTIYSFTVATTSVAILHNFDDPTVANDGTIPMGGLCVGADSNLYGTTVGGGVGSGTAFGLEINQGIASAFQVQGTYSLMGTLPTGVTFDSTTGLLLGTPSLAAKGGTYSIKITPGGGIFLGGAPVAQTLTINVVQPFANWLNLHSTSVVTPNTTGNDGVAMALKYLYDIAPDKAMTVADHAAMPALGIDATSMPGTPYVALIWRQNPGMIGVNVALESSDDMVHWSQVDGTVLPLLKQQAGTDNATGDPMMEMGTPADGSGHQFLRLVITPP